MEMVENAIIFDLDGLLADTEKLQIKAYQVVFAKYNLKLSEKVYEEHWIRKGLGIKEYAEINRLPIDYIELRKQKKIVYDGLIDELLQPMPFAVETVRLLSSKRKLALASASNSEAVNKVLNKLGIFHSFITIICGDQVKNQKPSPDIFLEAAKNMNMLPNNCIVIEDAEKGILAAQNAGMKSIAIPNIHTKNNNFDSATYVVKDLSYIEKIIEKIEKQN
jgi:HAD superfamily hydrolase (TIGR01509 family)